MIRDPATSPPNIPAAAAPDSAEAAAARAQEAAGATVRPLEELDEIQTASRLWREVWSREGESPVPTDLLRAMGHAGSYVSAAYIGDRMVGALLGFFAGEPPRLHLYSHILGVDPAHRRRGVGYALKLHQRAWAVRRGVAQIEWTFDPLVRANGWFNASKLGADGVEYLVNFYGAMPDGINSGDESDRVLLRWTLHAPSVAAAAGGTPRDHDRRQLAELGATHALSCEGDMPVRRRAQGDALLCQVPPDIVALRHRDPRLAREWRLAVRDVLSEALGRGLRITGMTRDGSYVLARGLDQRASWPA